jgi:ubiquinone/menaquinone biosynthesis C-methylase UbiE
MPDRSPVDIATDQKTRVRSFFDESKPWQGDLYGAQDDYFSRVIRRRKEYALAMLREVADLDRGKALDIGCGSGVYIEELLAMGFEVSGVDLAPEMLATCHKRFDGRAGARVQLHQADVEHLPFEDGQFDLVVCVGVLGYLLSDERALTEIQRVLKPGGYLLLNLTNMYSLSDADFVLRRKVRYLLRPSAPDPIGDASPEYALQSEWMLKHRGYFFKSYDLPQYEKILKGRGLIKTDVMTYGFEFRVLRGLGIFPRRWLDSAELALEKLVRKRKIPYLSYAGWVFTGVFRNERGGQAPLVHTSRPAQGEVAISG